jgi:hypothetical protein
VHNEASISSPSGSLPADRQGQEGLLTMKKERGTCSERGMQDVFLSYKNACASRQGLFITDEKFDSIEMY